MSKFWNIHSRFRLAQRYPFLKIACKEAGFVSSRFFASKKKLPLKDEIIRCEPIIAIMGHVDHGKTTLLDYIRKSSLASFEAGGITQSIGAFSANLSLNVRATFLDTPGHQLFSSMRSKSAQAADIVVLVIAIDDGIMPQTVESISIIKKANIPFLIAVNKCDKQVPQESKRKILDSLLMYDVVTEEDGGSVPVVYISALTGKGVSDLLETIDIFQTILDLTAKKSGLAQGVILESAKSNFMGPNSLLVVKSGTLTQGALLISNKNVCKLRKILDVNGNTIKSALPSSVVKTFGWKTPPDSGSFFSEVPNDSLGKKLLKSIEDKESNKIQSNVVQRNKIQSKNAQSNTVKQKNAQSNDVQPEDIQSNKVNAAIPLNVIIRADTQGSLQAVCMALSRINTFECKLNIQSSGIGQLTESDINLAHISKAKILLFNTEAPDMSKIAFGKNSSTDLSSAICSSNVIYDLVDQFKKLLEEILPEVEKEVNIGQAIILKIFQIYSKGENGIVCGLKVTSGFIKQNSFLKIYRREELVFQGKILSLKIASKPALKVENGKECGIIVKFSDPQPGDLVKVYETQRFKRKID